MDRSLSTTKTYLLSSDKPIKHSRLEARLDNTSGEVEINLCIRYDPKLHSATHLFTRAQRQVHNFYKNVGLSHLVTYRRKPEAKTVKSSAQATKEENPEATEEEILLSLSQEEQEFFNECELSQREASAEEEGLGGAGGFDRKRPPPAKEPEVVASKRTRTELASSEATNAGDKPAAGTSPGSITAGGSKPAATANGPAAATAAAATGTEDSSAAGSSLTAAATGKGSSNAPATASCSPRVELEATAPAAAADPAMDSPDGMSDLESATAAATAAAAELLSSSESGLFERIVAEAAARLVAKSPSPEDDGGRSHGVSNSSVFARLSRPASSKGSGRDNNTSKPVGSHKGRQSLARGSPQNGRNNQHQDRVVHLSEDEFVSGSPRTHGPNLSAGDSNGEEATPPASPPTGAPLPAGARPAAGPTAQPTQTEQAPQTQTWDRYFKLISQPGSGKMQLHFLLPDELHESVRQEVMRLRSLRATQGHVTVPKPAVPRAMGVEFDAFI